MNTRGRLWIFGLTGAVGTLPWFLAVKPAYAHGGFDAGRGAMAAWSWEPSIPLGIILAGALYVAGLRNWRNPTHPVGAWRRVSFFAGLAVIFLALQSPLDRLSDHLFLMHQVQHLLLRMVGPPLLLLGAPLTPMLRGLPGAARQRLLKPLVRNKDVRRAYAYLTHPMVAAVLFLGTLFFWQGPWTHDLSVRNGGVHYVMHFSMFMAGMLFWWVIVDPKPHRSWLPYSLRALYLGVLILPNTLLGAIVAFSGGVLYTAYGAPERLWGISPLTDQAIGGAILWIPGDMMLAAAAFVMIGLWLNEDERKHLAKPARGAAGYASRGPTGGLESP